MNFGFQPINNSANTSIYVRYRQRADAMKNYVFGGRLAEYKYYDMHAVAGAAMLRFQSLEFD